jgi:hypothetical protein
MVCAVKVYYVQNGLCKSARAPDWVSCTLEKGSLNSMAFLGFQFHFTQCVRRGGPVDAGLLSAIVWHGASLGNLGIRRADDDMT